MQVLIGLVLFVGLACGIQSERRGVPPQVEAVVSSVGEDINAERYEKIYVEAAELWKQESSLEQTVASFSTLNEKLGKVKSRVLHSATEQQNSGGVLKGEVFILTYQTEFEKAQGMETFTLVKRDGRWQLARYFVNSMALK
ncbi:MAG TPA: DUF4019 domain-containing protein [Pyrinomonadaceae bacterium]|nr:DUF4019 domain-containing protein [Pyrinomonadaceae bacterium]